MAVLAALLTLLGCPAEQRPEEATVAAAETGGGFRDVVREVIPSIVFIETEAEAPPELQRLLPPGLVLPDRPIPLGMGSGVLFTSDGYILTNNHVVQAADRVRVVLQDRRHFEAQVVGRDPSTDVAVVRIVGSGFPAARFGDSDEVQLGDWVLALGSPLGLQFSVTAGVVSGLGRSIGILGMQMPRGGAQAAPLEHFIQTDAALSPGNSGGPLVDAGGAIIGINTAVAAPGMAGNVGFAIPSNLARRVAQQLIEFGEVRRAYLGVSLLNVTPSLAAAHGLERVEGAMVAGTEPGGPAAAAGLQEGDVILDLDGRPIVTVSDLQNQLLRLEPGSAVEITIRRAGRDMTVRAQLGRVTGGIGPT